MANGIEKVIGNLLPGSREMDAIELQTVMLANTIISASAERHTKEISRAFGGMAGLMASSAVYSRLAGVLEETEFEFVADGSCKMPKREAVNGVRNIAIASEGSYFLLDSLIRGNFGDLSLEPSRAEFEGTAGIAANRLRKYLAEAQSFPALAKGIIYAINAKPEPVIENLYDFHQKPNLRILHNGTAACLAEMVRLSLSKCEKEEFADAASAAFGLELAAKMYRAAADIVRENQEMCFLTYDSGSEQAAISARKIFLLSDYSRELVSAEAAHLGLSCRFGFPKQVSCLATAEEMGPAHLRRALFGLNGKLPPSADAVLRMSYKGIPEQDVAAYAQQHSHDLHLSPESKVAYHSEALERLEKRLSEAEKKIF